MTGPVPTMPPGGTPAYAGLQTKKNNNNALLIGGGAILGIAILLLLLKMSGIFAAPAEAPSAVLIKTTTPPAPALQKIAEAPPEMPADVLAWLKHLERIEREKKELETKQYVELLPYLTKIRGAGAALGELEPPAEAGGDAKDPRDLTKEKFEDLKPRWEALLTDFESVPPPEECRGIALDYGRAMREIPGMVGDLNSLLNPVEGTDASSALAKAADIDKRQHDRIDGPFAEADQKVQNICDKYRKAKWFNIGDAGQGVFGKL